MISAYLNLRQFRMLESGLITIIALSMLTSCHLFRKKSNQRKGGQPAGLIDTSSIFIDRTDTRKIAYVRFNATAPVHCQLNYWPQTESEEEPPAAEQSTHPCTATARTEVTEALQPLDSEVLYTVKIFAWQEGQSLAQAQTLLVNESPEGGAAELNALKSQTLVVVRFDSPLHSAEVHQHQLDRPRSTQEVLSMIKLNSGCRRGPPENLAPFSSHVGNQIETLATRGFAAANGERHPNDAQRYRLYFNTLQFGDNWDWTYTEGGQSRRFLSQSATRLADLTVSSAEPIQFSSADLHQPLGNQSIDVSQPLKLEWRANHLPNASPAYMTLRIGHTSDDHQVFCAFAAKDGKAEVESRWLQDLPSGNHILLASLVAHQIQMVNESQIPRWLIQTHDWQAARFSKP